MLDYSIMVGQVMLRIDLRQEADGVKVYVETDAEKELLCFVVVSDRDLEIDFVSVEAGREYEIWGSFRKLRLIQRQCARNPEH